MMDKHTKTLDQLLRHPSLINIQDVVWAAKEPQCFYDGLFVEPDLLIRSRGYYRPFFVIEYKSSGAHRDKAIDQLRRAEDFLYEHFGDDCYKLLVTPRGSHKPIGFNVEYIDGIPERINE